MKAPNNNQNWIVNWKINLADFYNFQAASQIQGLRKTPSWDRSSSSSGEIFKIPADDCDIVWSMGDRKRKIENERTKDVT